MNIGERIRKSRKENNLTQEQLADLINKSPQVISNWERGYTSTINHDDIAKLSVVLKVSPNYLLGINNTQIIPEMERKKAEIKKALLSLISHDDGEFPIEDGLVNTVFEHIEKAKEFHAKRKGDQKK